MDSSLVVVIIALLSLGLAYFTYFLSKYTDKLTQQIKNIKDEGERTIFENALKDFHDVVDKTVKFTEQVVVKDLKEKSSDGVLSTDDLKEIGADALNKVLENISPKTKTILEKNIVDLEKYATATIETKVFDIKNNKTN